MFGENCTEHCGNCLNSEQCHHINGTCMNGCDRGYEGLYCTEGKSLLISHAISNISFCLFFIFKLWLSECDIGTYGDNCNETCGNCKDQSECHHSNGTCLTGCNDGFQGALCKTRKSLTVHTYVYIDYVCMLVFNQKEKTVEPNDTDIFVYTYKWS